MSSITLRLAGSESLIRALDDHIQTCELAKQLALEADDLRESIMALRLRYAELVHAQREQMRDELVARGWLEFRPSIWRSPGGRTFRGTALAWHNMRGLTL